jgi:hypothetical protein
VASTDTPIDDLTPDTFADVWWGANGIDALIWADEIPYAAAERHEPVALAAIAEEPS